MADQLAKQTDGVVDIGVFHMERRWLLFSHWIETNENDGNKEYYISSPFYSVIGKWNGTNKQTNLVSH